MGCSGGWLRNVWKYFERQGVVSDDCKPYASGTGVSPTCTEGACSSKAVSGATDTHYYAVNSKNCEADVNCIKEAIATSGPV